MNKFALALFSILLLLLLIVAVVKAGGGAQGKILVESIKHQPELWLINGNHFYHFKDRDTQIKASKLTSSWDIEELSDLKIYVSSKDHVKVTDPYSYRFSNEEQAIIWEAYNDFADKYISSVIRKEPIIKNTSPRFAVPIKENKDGLIKIETPIVKVSEVEQNTISLYRAGLLMGWILILLFVAVAFICALFLSKGFRESVFKNCK